MICRAQWLSWWNVGLEIEWLIVGDSLQTESPCCVFDLDTLSAVLVQTRKTGNRSES